MLTAALPAFMVHVNRRALLLIATIVLTIAMPVRSTLAAERDSSARPNIIFILADDLGYGDLGCYGQKNIKTPHIDTLAREGMRFTDFYSGSTVCAPARCVLMTGLHSGHAWIRGNERVPLRPEDVTVAEVLQAAGYETALCGKWGLGEPETSGIPNKQGFDHFYGYLNQRHAHNYYPTYLWRNEQRVPLRNVVPNEGAVGEGRASKKIDYTHTLVVEEALEFVDRDHEQPFFLYLALTIPHANNEAGRAGMEVPELGQYADKDWPAPQKGHAAMISLMDHDIGRLMALLKQRGIDENTIVMFSSDNGPHREGGNNPNFNNSNGPLRGIKRDLYEGGIRVPLVARWPGKIAPGSESNHIAAFWDFLPTAAELAGTEPPENVDGLSFVPTLLGQGKPPQHKFLYWEFHEQGKKQAVRQGQWKLVRLLKGNSPKVELYDLSRDLGEKNNIAEDHPERVEKMLRYMDESHTENPNWKL